MSDALYLAWRYLAYNRGKTAILVFAVTLILYLPVGLNVLVGQSAAHLTARAEATPLLVGAPGSPLELTLNSLYFESETPEPTRYSELTTIDDSELAQAIPLYVRFRAQGFPIVGTSLEYFELRGLDLADGRHMAVLGECVLGAAVAGALGLGPGSTIVSSPESVFDLAGAYPLKMHVTGMLSPSYGPDDLVGLDTPALEKVHDELEKARLIEAQVTYDPDNPLGLITIHVGRDYYSSSGSARACDGALTPEAAKNLLEALSFWFYGRGTG